MELRALVEEARVASLISEPVDSVVEELEAHYGLPAKHLWRLAQAGEIQLEADFFKKLGAAAKKGWDTAKKIGSAAKKGWDTAKEIGSQFKQGFQHGYSGGSGEPAKTEPSPAAMPATGAAAAAAPPAGKAAAPRKAAAPKRTGTCKPGEKMVYGTCRVVKNRKADMGAKAMVKPKAKASKGAAKKAGASRKRA